MSEQVDPRLVEIEILSEADRALVYGSGSYDFRKVGASGAHERQREEAVIGLLFDRALVGGTHYKPTDTGYRPVPDARPPNPSYGIDAAAAEGVAEFLSNKDIIHLRITQRGRLRLFRLRDEILQRDRIRDDFGVLWAHRHWLPDLTVRLRLRDPNEPFSLIVLDVDHLKKLNTELGHPGANQVLTGIFEILRDTVQPYEAYRIGGDEAGAILPGVSLAAARKVGEEIRQTIEARSWPAVLTIETKPTVSVGVGTYASDKPISPDALYNAVDTIAELAKKARNAVEAAVVPPTTT
jgi:diguanylate cyclase (GGDEF)-like protein